MHCIIKIIFVLNVIVYLFELLGVKLENSFSIQYLRKLRKPIRTETFLDLHLLTCSLIKQGNYVDMFRCSAKTRAMYVDFLKYNLVCRFYLSALRNYVVIGIAT